MTTEDQNNYKRALKILHGALLMGPFLFLCISYFLVEFSDFSTSFSEYANQILIAVIFIAILSVLFYRSFFSKKVDALRSSGDSIERKMDKYRGICITSWATLEFPELLIVILYLLTGNIYILLTALLLMIHFYMQRPTPQKIARDLGLPELDF